jgi:hypothetical protein
VERIAIVEMPPNVLARALRGRGQTIAPL